MSIVMLLALFGLLSGVTTVLFGFGGGFVVVPLLYCLLSTRLGPAAMHFAVGTSTAVMMVSSALATLRHARRGTLIRSELWPLAGFIGLGSVIGALLATQASGTLLHRAFILYLAVTIIDCLARKGFLETTTAPRRLVRPAGTAVLGASIGVVATFLGVGGSVMSVPLMRRRGIDMTRATAMANPLTLPVAVVGTACFILLPAATPRAAPAWSLGAVDLQAFAILVAASLIGMQLSAPFIGRIPDRWHARAYIALLTLVLASMLA